MPISILTATLLAILGIYFIAMSRIAEEVTPAKQRQHLLFFGVGLIAALVAFIPSPNLFGPNYRFTVNMAQFTLLTGIAPPLLWLGTPSAMMRLAGRGESLARRLTSPTIAYLSAIPIILAWHAPIAFETASRDLAIWNLKQGILLGAGLLAWGPVLATLPANRRLPYSVQVLYLFLLPIPTTVLGALFAFADGLVYSSRALAFEICAPASPADQQTAGLLMWMSGAAVYLTALTIVFFRWFGETETASETREF